jgi:nitroimidazol reductase NimA-like FMN-containing flavoprotein (pyridoxamine 5'-phosphate oxidase superfamily)
MTSSTPSTPPSERACVRRAAERGHYDSETVHAIIDAAWVCHVAFADTAEPDSPVLCMPTACWRLDDRIYIHGSNGSRMMKRLASGAPTCVTITHLDGLVLARSAFSHSMNYRSAVIHGRFELVDDSDKPAVLDALMDHIAPGRRHEVRAPDSSELKATTVLGLSLAESAAKIRNWGPRDKEGDETLPVWAGVLPLHEAHGTPQPDPGSEPMALPEHLRHWA